MKKIILYGVSMLSLLFAVRATICAQHQKDPFLQQWLSGIAIPTGFGLNDITLGKPIDSDVISDKIQLAFYKTFEVTSDVVWYAVDKRYHLFGVRFKHNKRDGLALFTRRGGLIYSIFPISQEELSKEDYRTIKANYMNYAISSIIEVTRDRHTKSIAHLDDGRHFLLVCMENGFLEVVKSYTTKPN